MKFTTSFLALFTALPLSFAAPAANPEPSTNTGTELTKRGLPGNVYICSGAKWTDYCKIVHVGTDGLSTCTKLPYDTVGSIGPDEGAYCIVYEASPNSRPPCDSSAASVGLKNPGESDLYRLYNGFGYRARYIACWRY